jgi:hypothetical protein
VFRRRGKGQPADSATDDSGADGAEEVREPLGETESAPDPTRAEQPGTGPYDVDEAPADELPRIDLGALRVPLVEGVEVRLDMDEQTGEPTQLVLADGESLLQLGVFAAPRTGGIWEPIRAEISQSLAEAGGSAEEIDGPLGMELIASVPTGDPAAAFAPARFVGVDRPRWFLRGLFSGPAAVDPAMAGRLEFAIRGTIVVRGKEALPSRDPLPLRLPPEAKQLAEEQMQRQSDEPAGAPTLDQLDPGPTITETR